MIMLITEVTRYMWHFGHMTLHRTSLRQEIRDHQFHFRVRVRYSCLLKIVWNVSLYRAMVLFPYDVCYVYKESHLEHPLRAVQRLPRSSWFTFRLCSNWHLPPPWSPHLLRHSTPHLPSYLPMSMIILLSGVSFFSAWHTNLRSWEGTRRSWYSRECYCKPINGEFSG